MTGKRFEVHHMIRDYSTTEDVDFDFLQKLINEHRQPKDLTMHITDCGKDMTYRECEYLLNKYYEENKELKEKLDDILELTELTGMIHLRKAEIRSIIQR